MSIDRDALYELLWDWRVAWMSGGTGASTDQEVDAILALVRPVEGVTLTPEEASACSWALGHLVAKHNYDALRGRDGSRVDLRALAARLEASS